MVQRVGEASDAGVLAFKVSPANQKPRQRRPILSQVLYVGPLIQLQAYVALFAALPGALVPDL